VRTRCSTNCERKSRTVRLEHVARQLSVKIVSDRTQPVIKSEFARLGIDDCHNSSDGPSFPRDERRSAALGIIDEGRKVRLCLENADGSHRT
jgi:hypothetical protein